MLFFAGGLGNGIGSGGSPAVANIIGGVVVDLNEQTQIDIEQVQQLIDVEKTNNVIDANRQDNVLDIKVSGKKIDFKVCD
jgi:hypothetical protein